MKLVIGILKLHNRFGYINRRGKLQIQAIYAKASPFSEGKAAAQYFNGKWVYLNEDGRVQFKNARFDYAIPFSDGLAGVNNGAEWELGVGGSLMFKGGGNWGYIDKQGEKVIPLRYQWVTPFRNERAKVAYKGKVWVIDTKGKLLFQIPKLTPPIITEQQTPLPMLPPSKP